jgi:protein KRI1
VLRLLIVALQDLDLEGDWDSEAHDRQMAGIYAQDDDGEFYDEEKPTWDDDINVDDIMPPPPSASKGKRNKKDRKKGKAAGGEDEGYEVGEGDEAYGEWDDEEWDGTEEMRKKKLQEYMDSLLELEFNDVVSAVRFQHDRVSHHPPS